MSSPRKLVLDALCDKLRQLRNRSYDVIRGPVNWAAYDFKGRRAVGVVTDSLTLFRVPGGIGEHSMDVSMEMFAQLEGDVIALNDDLVDELIEDARAAVEHLRTAKIGADPLVFRLSGGTIVEVTDPDEGIQGIIATFTVDH